MHMKKREFGTRSLIEPSNIITDRREDTSQSHITDFVDDLMDMDETDNNNSGKSNNAKPNFLVKNPKKSKEKQSNLSGNRKISYPLVLIE